MSSRWRNRWCFTPRTRNRTSRMNEMWVHSLSGTTPPQMRAAVQWLTTAPSGASRSAALALTTTVSGTTDATDTPANTGRNSELVSRRREMPSEGPSLVRKGAVTEVGGVPGIRTEWQNRRAGPWGYQQLVQL